MKHLSLLALLIAFSSVPAKAEDAAKPAAEAATETSVTAEQLALAEKMHEIWPTRMRIESAIANAAESFPEAKRAEVKAALRKNIQFDQVEEESIKAMAETFSAEELQAMIDFYGSENGRSISAKTGDYERALRPSLIKMMDKAMLDLKTGKTP